MKPSPIAALLGLAALATASRVLPRNFDSNDYYVVHLARDVSPNEVARSLGMDYEGPLGENLADHHVLVTRKSEHDVVKREITERRRRKRSLGERDLLDGVLFTEKQRLRAPWEKRVIPHPPVGPMLRVRQEVASEAAIQKQLAIATAHGIKDPIFNEQWHLFNPIQLGHDVNVTGVWAQGITGKNATVSIVDDGLDMYSDDLKDNYYAAGSYDFNDKSDEPKPRLVDDRHGTRCAGEVSAAKNNVCGVGVAWDSKISGLRILSKLISDADEAVAMNYDFHHNHIYSCSWGPPDDGRSMDAPGILIRRAMLNAVQNGRNGLGSIYVFASGNGAANDDNCNFDGYTNSIYSITVGAIDRKGKHPYYSEACSAGLVVTYSSGSGDAIHTTDVGQNACYSGHGGTSAAAPLAAGIFALVLEVRPDLTWRDMQYLAMMTAIPVNMEDGAWQATTIGKKFSHTYGYGKIDSYAIVEASKTWKNVKPQAWFYSPWIHVNQAIPQGEQGIAVSFDVTPDMLADANLERLEHVTVTMNVAHTRRGDLSVDLVSPNKVISHLSVPRKLDNAGEGYDDWTFMSVVHWGETGLGTWTIIVRDTKVNEHNGTFIDWHLKLWGESKDASKATLLPMPTEEDDNDHAALPTTTAPAVIATLPATFVNPGAGANPTDQPNRPVKAKPTGTGAPQSTSDSTWLSNLPNFGLSGKAQAWIYGALALIIVFCLALGAYLYMAHRKRMASSREDYQFELLDEEEGEGLAGNGGAVGEKRKGAAGRRTRGGELYDAFAGGSDDEDDFIPAEYRDNSGSGGRGSGDSDGVRNEKRRLGREEESDEEEHHVVGDDEDDSGDEAERPLQGRR